MEEAQVKQVGYWLGWSAVLLLLLAVGGISLISMGVFDPPVVGDEETVLALSRELTTHNTQIEWLDITPGSEAFSVRLAAAYQSGDQDSGYGLALGSPDGYLVAAISPGGYVTIFEGSNAQLAVSNQQSADSNEPFTIHHSQFIIHNSLLPWQPWPHIWHGTDSNEFLLEATETQFTVRVNRELLWQGEWQGRGRDIGLYLTTYNQPVTIVFQELTVTR